jgi:hypothetical protein
MLIALISASVICLCVLCVSVCSVVAEIVASKNR